MEYQYDMLGNKVYQNSMDAGQRWLLLNIAGNPLRTWDERNHELQYFYDILHRPILSRMKGGDAPGISLDNIFERVFYGENETNDKQKNLRGKPIRLFDTGGLIETPAYDLKGHPLSITRKLFSKYKEVVNWIDPNLQNDLENEDFIFRTETDALGRIIKQTFPDESTVNPFYNEAGLLNGETVTHVNPALTTIYIKDISYNEKGQRNKIIYGNDVTATFSYDKETFRLKKLETRRQNNDLLQDLNYTYDPVGNIVFIRDDAYDPEFFNNQVTASISSYTYDAVYRLTEATGRENAAALNFDVEDNWSDAPYMQLNPATVAQYTQRYRYDQAGNILEMNHLNKWTRTYEYETNNNRLKNTRIGQGANTFTYLYPHHSEQGFITAMPHLEEMGWNFKEELIKTIRQKVNLGNGTPETTWYQYDGQGQRIRKVTENSAQAGIAPTKKDERVYVSGYAVYKKYTGADAGLERSTLSLLDKGHRFVMIETRNSIDDGTEKRLVRYQLHNHLGSAALELDPIARVISYEEYYPFGSTAYQIKNNAINCAAKRYRYTGMERDEETGLEYHSARYYLPWLGRWLTCDPAGIVDGPNPYIYADNAPVTGTDPTGLGVYRIDDIHRPEKSVWVDLPEAVGEQMPDFFDLPGMPLGRTATRVDPPKGPIPTIAEPKLSDPPLVEAPPPIVGLSAPPLVAAPPSMPSNLSKTQQPQPSVLSKVWNWLFGNDAVVEDSLEVIGHLTWGLPGTLLGIATTVANFTIGNLVTGIHNLFTNDADDWEYASVSIGGPNNEDDIIGNYGGFLNLGGGAITFGPFVFFAGSKQDFAATGASGIQDYYANHDQPTPGWPYGATKGLRTAEHEEGHEDQNLIYGPFALLIGLVFSLVPNIVGANPKTSPLYWYDRQANRLSGQNSPVNPGPP